MKLRPDHRPPALDTCHVQRGRGTCPKTVPPGMLICGDCANQLTAGLLLVGQTMHGLDAAYLKLQRFSTARHGTAHPDESPVPWNEAAGRALEELVTAMTETADGIAQRRGLFRPLDTFDALGLWLARQVSWLRSRPEGPQVLQYLTHYLVAADRVVDAPSMRTFVGRCPGTITPDDGDPQQCNAELWATRERHASEVECRQCGATWPIADRRRSLLSKADDMLLTRTELARALSGFGVDVTVKQLEGWATRGRLAARGNTNTRPARPLYRLGDVLDILHADEQRDAPRLAKA